MRPRPPRLLRLWPLPACRHHWHLLLRGPRPRLLWQRQRPRPRRRLWRQRRHRKRRRRRHCHPGRRRPTAPCPSGSRSCGTARKRPCATSAMCDSPRASGWASSWQRARGCTMGTCWVLRTSLVRQPGECSPSRRNFPLAQRPPPQRLHPRPHHVWPSLRRRRLRRRPVPKTRGQPPFRPRRRRRTAPSRWARRSRGRARRASCATSEM
mmetsp:Transcript_175684/g.563410  ORF Transcript_175684/g.563410 Transcript_175684/m.563410 type:complete len:209 (+) Transcript_175684:392-1018(+)